MSDTFPKLEPSLPDLIDSNSDFDSDVVDDLFPSSFDDVLPNRHANEHFFVTADRVVVLENFKAGGAHQLDVLQNWWSLPEVPKWVKHWVWDRVWFSKSIVHRDDHSAKNAQCFDLGSSKFDEASLPS